MKPLILHIPHSSTHIPFKDGFVHDNNLIEHEINKLTDWYTDELFYSPEDITLKADFSRIFCDPERFREDSKEVMAQFGMGVLYEKTDDGKKLREINDSLRNRILNKYYFPHHENLNNAVKNQLNKFGNAFIVDCHSFSDIPFIRDTDKRPNRPDINIGTDRFHTDRSILDFTVSYFNAQGLSPGIDWPYSGTIVPVTYYRKNNKVGSIMIEVNRKLYLKDDSIVKNDHFENIQTIIQKYLSALKNNIFH